MSIKNYLFDFKKPLKVFTLLNAFFWLVVLLYHDNYYASNCFAGQGLQESACSQYFLNYIFIPFSSTASLWFVLFLVLALLPLRYLRDWWLAIATWYLPIGIILFLRSEVQQTASIVGVLPSGPHAAMALMAELLLYITVFYIVIRFGADWWQKRR